MIEATSQQRSRDTALWRRGQLLLVLVGLLCVLSITFLISEIIRDLRFLNSARSDNVHWVLSQAEVEFLDFRNAVQTAQSGTDPDALEELIVEFDVFYSRVDTLHTGTLYSELRKIEAFGQSITTIRNRLDAVIPIIDGPRDELRAALPALNEVADEIRPLLRTAATTGLQYFVERSDQSRENFASTLLRLALIAAALVLALIVLLGHTRRVGKQTETRGHELADAYSRLNTILETSLDAVIVADLDGRILNFNKAAERTFQYSTDEVLGKNIADIVVPDHHRAAHDAGMHRMRVSGEQRVVGQGRVRLEAKRRNGEIFPVELALEMAESGEDEMIVAFLRDISHRVAAETELVEARDKALAGEKAKADFLAMMTHEIRTPLNGLLGNLALLEKTSLSVTQDRYVRNMDISGGVLMHHVDAVLDVARFEAGAAEPREEVVHIGRLIQDIVDSQASAAEANGNHIQWGWIGDPATWVRIDASRLQQVLLNLVGNAIKFTRDGRIVIEGECNQSGLDLRVIDTGVGISEADQERIFGDFQTIDSAGEGAPAGTGLGLGIARRFIEAMGGEIGVESTEGEGSVFWVSLPLVCVDGPEKEDVTVTAGPNEQGRNILLVEDNEINLELAGETLFGLGHSVTEAHNGQEAVEAAQEERFDLILMDIRMPVLDGLGATRAIRAGNGPNRDVPIVAFSANVLPEAKDRFIEAGMSGFLPKPLVEEELVRVINQFTSGEQSAVEASVAPQKEQNTLDRLTARYVSQTNALFDWLDTRPDDMSEIAAEAHKVAGSAAAFGQPDLRDALVAVEMAADSADRDLMERAIETARQTREHLPDPSLS
ncbi:ATP-binding protein [Roseovarius sp.]|uniref:hybrid sensor histidine kinase/response regulator n=1 Tax=Roseovarius sp. TaxID=1486281 RepID=UPI003D101BE8